MTRKMCKIEQGEKVVAILQLDILQASIPGWILFSMTQNGNLKGGDPLLTDWKKEEANRIMALPAFQTLPEKVSRLALCK